MWLVPLYTDYTGADRLDRHRGDLARFGRPSLAAARSRAAHPEAETVASMLDGGYGGNTGPDSDRMGLGWHWWDDAPVPFKGHGGDGPGFGAQLAIFPAEKMVVEPRRRSSV